MGFLEKLRFRDGLMWTVGLTVEQTRHLVVDNYLFSTTKYYRQLKGGKGEGERAGIVAKTLENRIFTAERLNTFVAYFCFILFW